MNSFWRVCVLVALVGSSCCAQPREVPIQSPQPTSRKFSASEIHDDLLVARAALEEGHSGLYRYTTKAELDRVFDKELRSFVGPADAFALYRSLSRIAGAIKDGHTSAGLPDSLRTEMNNKALLLPLEVRFLGDRLYVLRDLANDSAQLDGLEITAINRVPARLLLKEMLEATPADAGIPAARARGVSSWRFNRILWSLVQLRSPFTVEVALAGGKHRRVHLAGMELPRLMREARARAPQSQGPPDPASLAFLPGTRSALMRISSFEGFADLAGSKPLAAFLEESFAALRQQGTTSLILDLRNNGGGRDVIGRILYSYLATEPFRYYRDLTINAVDFQFMKYVAEPELPGPRMFQRDSAGRLHGIGHANWGTHAPSPNRFNGRVLVLVNGGCQSGCAEFASIAHHLRRATFIGEEVGGGYDGNTSGFTAVVTLPNTRSVLVIPLMSYYMAVDSISGRKGGVRPHHPVTYTISELIAGVDKEKAIALSMVN